MLMVKLHLLNRVSGQHMQNITNLTPCYRPVESAVAANIQWQSNALLRPCRSNKILEGSIDVMREGTVGGERNT
jgi:hypothetical protein